MFHVKHFGFYESHSERGEESLLLALSRLREEFWLQ